MTDLSSNLPFKVAALYRFARLDYYQSLQEPLAKLCCGLGIRGTLLLAAEGVNGTVAGSAAAIQQLVDFLNAEPAIAGMELKYSYASEMPFKRMKVRLKKEIVTMGVADIDPLQSVGTYVEPENWNALIAASDTILIDTRNDYETAIGTFAGAVDPQTKTFREFPQWVEDHRDELEGKKIAMFCTGGIRCEKATAFVKGLGFEDVFHLKGGILKYLEDVPAEESRWEGECFVFDERVSVGHGLVEGEAELCYACRNPIAPEDKLSPLFEEGVSCPHCYHERTEADRARFAERQKQVRLARARGAKEHLGS
ncbi:oxygen-dependent tRNA uridine(34) hydroxylase TrhO [Phyllobacterium pellucidum]|uniref:oxygen-dependent tRNA uridine(34) hydroxylase TrhO n=1 Tax=Phyllobacterium pellucidum TaxID=2740464 RepID=UPI001D15DEDF|nr:rhodanese-related sulfurtransferase [Phyllobacterium sp. T1018]UGY09573.1 rhodanese-related sulfurtransferase [Phyllobacterium sp. T1018]